MHTITITVRDHADHRVDVALTFADGTDAEAGTTEALYPLYESIQHHLRQQQLESQSHATGRFQLRSSRAVEWGRALAEALPGSVVQLLDEQLQQKPVRQLDLAFELNSNEGGSARWLHRLPWELLLLPNRQIPVALEPHVAMYRRINGSTSDIAPSTGPLRVVFAVSAPDQLADRPGEALDWAREQAWMEDALSQHTARLVPADEGNLEYIGALTQQVSPHVLHLSGHGSSNKLQMEDLLGLPAPVGRDEFNEFCTKLPDSVRLVVLSQCQSGSPEVSAGDDVQSERDLFISFAVQAAEVRGMAVGMQFPVGDQVASWWARSFYSALEKGSPVPRAVATARREIFSQITKIRDRTGTSAGFTGTEWVTPVFYVAGEPITLVDHAEATDLAVDPWVFELPPSLDDLDSHRGPAAFVGRRSERRRLRRAVFGHPGAKPVVGVAIYGLGGMGKSTLAAHLLEMLIDKARTPHHESWKHVSVSGRLDLLDLAVQLRKTVRFKDMAERRQALPSSRKAWKGDDDDLAEKLLDYFSALIERNHRLVLVFDDFEANLVSAHRGKGGADHERSDQLSIADQQVRTFLEDLVEIAQGVSSNPLLLLFTCRYPVPLGPTTESQSLNRWLNLPLGPLGQGEEKHLLRRLSITGDRAFMSQLVPLLEGYAGALPGYGGHPRSLEVAIVAAAVLMDSTLSAKHQSQLNIVRNWLPEKLLAQVEEKARASHPSIGTDVLALSAIEAAVPELLADLRSEERSLLDGLAIFAAPFTSQAAYAAAHALEQPPDQVSARFDHLKRLGLIAPARQLSARPRDESGEERTPHRLWLVPNLVGHLLQDQLDQLQFQPTALVAINAAAARHLAWRETQEGLHGDELLTLDRIAVVHAIRGAVWMLAHRSILRVLSDAVLTGRWQYGCDQGVNILAELEKVPEKTVNGWIQCRAAVAFRLSTLFNVLGKPIEAQQQLDAAWSALVPEQHQQQPGPWIDSLVGQLELQSEESDLLIATSRLLSEFARIDQAQGRSNQARERFEQALKIEEKIGDVRGYAASLHALGVIDHSQGNYNKARERLEQSLGIAEKIGDVRGNAASLHALATIDQAQGRYNEARERFETSHKISTKLGDARGYTASLLALATIERAQGRYNEARERLEQILDFSEKLGDLNGYAAILHEVATIDLVQSRYGEARGKLEQSLQISEKIKDTRGYAASLHMLANVDRAQGRHDAASGKLEQSLRISEGIGNLSGCSASLHALASIDQAQGRYDAARKRLERALDIAKELGDPGGSGASLHVLGTIDQAQGRYAEARERFEQSLEIANQLRDMRGQGVSLHELARIDLAQGRYDAARERLRQSLTIKEKLGDKRGYGASVHELGNVDRAQGRYEEASKRLEQSLEIKEQIGDLGGYSVALHELGNIDLLQGRYEEGRKRLEQSLEIKEQLGDVKGIGASLHALANIDLAQGRYDKARERLKQSLEIKEKLGDVKGIGDSLYALASIDRAQGRYDAALSGLERSLEISEEIGDPSGKSASLFELARIDQAQGRYDAARERLEQSLKISEKLEDLSGESASYHELARIDQVQGRYDEARERLEHALEIEEKLRDVRGYGASLHALATIDEAQGRYDMARERLEQSLKISEKLEDLSGRAASLHALAKIDQAQGHYNDARERLGKAMEIKETLGDQRGVGVSLYAIASIDQAQGRYDEARERLEQALRINEKLGDQRGYGASLHALATISQLQGRLDEARERLEQALEIKEKLGDQRGSAATMTMLGQQLVASDPARALRLLETALSIFTRLGSGEVDKARGLVQSTCASLIGALGEVEQREGMADLAYMLWLRGWAHRLRDELDLARDDLKAARSLNREAGQDGGERACDDQLSMLDEGGYHHWGDTPGGPVGLLASAGEALDAAEVLLEQDRVNDVLALLMRWQPRSGAPSADEQPHLLARVLSLDADVRGRLEPQLSVGQLDLALGKFLTELGCRPEATTYLVAAEEAMTGAEEVAGALRASLVRSRNLPASEGIELAEACLVRAEHAGLKAEARIAKRMIESLSTAPGIVTETGEEESP